MIAAYERHNAEVRASIPTDQLLEWTATDGWFPICERLGLPSPRSPSRSPTPTEQFQAMMAGADTDPSTDD